MFTAKDERTALEAVPEGLFIDGQWRPAASGGTFPVEDPSTGQVVAEVSDGSAQDAQDALGAAHRAGPAWASTPPRERGEILRRAYQALVDRTEELALVMTLEMGKPLDHSRSEIAYAAEFFRWFSEEAVRVRGDWLVAPDGRGRLLTMRQPVGPCLFVTPWNFPIAMGTRKIGPALAAGCTVVIKPAALTPLSMLSLARILEDAGLPAGVLNVVTTSSSGRTLEPLYGDGRLRKLSFTGSTEVGRSLYARAAEGVLRISMELGGNAPFLVFADADLDAAVDGAVQAKMRNVGEACTAANRFHVESEVAGEFSRRLAERLEAMKVGRGTEAGVEVGPLVDEATRDKVDELVRDAVGRGAEVLTGGEAISGPGHFYRPTVLGSVPGGSRLLSEEVFGPVAPVVSFETEEEAVRAANDTEFGLVAYVYTSDLKRAIRVIEGLETGMVGLNRGLVSNPAAPFGGVKSSGIGREGGREGIEEYLETKYVAIDL
ncbi:MAG: NAD-dependent succinate-semialdehyde dehydrogenase [Acidimicrobiales bacterium]